jgi:hypothetical protein
MNPTETVMSKVQSVRSFQILLLVAKAVRRVNLGHTTENPILTTGTKRVTKRWTLLNHLFETCDFV